MRLIDADELIKRLQEFADNDWNKSLGGIFIDCIDTCIDYVENQPTAYDVEKVVAELEKEMVRAEEWAREEMGRDGNELNFEHYVGERNAYMEAITIARYGGKE